MTASRIFMATLLMAPAIIIAGCDSKPKPGEDMQSSEVEALPAEQVREQVDISSAKADADSWMALEADDDGFNAKFPVAPKKQDLTVPTPAGTIPAVMYMAETADEAVGLTVLEVPAEILGSGQFSVEGGLDGARDGMINNVGGTIVSEKHVQFAGHDARAVVGKVEADETHMTIDARLFWVSPRMYQLIVVHETGRASSSEKFFAGFELVKAEGADPEPKPKAEGG